MDLVLFLSLIFLVHSMEIIIISTWQELCKIRDEMKSALHSI